MTVSPSSPAPSSQTKKLPRSLRAELASATAQSLGKTSLALGMSTALLMPLTALAAETVERNVKADQETKTLTTLKVEDTVIEPNPNAESGVPYKAKTSGDARRTRPLAETPATIQVLTSEQIKDSGYTDLREILDTVPGITLGTGENGNAFGDRYIIRGQEARSDVFVDGLRDPGMTTRESFATEQVEVTKGASSSFAGRGSTGGAVNSVTKQATTDGSFTKLSTGVGSDEYRRMTLDVNQRLSDDTAIRANLLTADEDVPDREPAHRQREGAALSWSHQATRNLDVTLDYYLLNADDSPDIGGYLVGTVPNRKPAKHVPVYAQEEDFLNTDSEIFTSRVNYRIDEAMRFMNLTRYGETANGYVVTGARAASANANNPGGPYDTFTLSTHQGWQEVEYFGNQSNLFIDSDIGGGRKNELVLGIEYTENKVLNGVYDVTNSGQNCITGTGNTLNAWCGRDASGNVIDGLNNVMNRQITQGHWDQDWAIDTTSLYLLDTLDLTEQLTAFGGVRYDYFDYSLRANWDHDGDGRNGTPTVLGHFKDSAGFWNGHLGLSFQITEEGNVYASIGTAKDINGGESDVGTNSGYGGLAVNLKCADQTNADPAVRGCDPNGDIAAQPESTVNMEIGTKWNVLDERLLLTAAVFQIDKKDVMEGAGYTSTGSFNTGENQVRGVEFSITGELAERLQGQIGAAFMKAKIKDAALRGIGNPAVPTSIEGKTLSNFAEETAFAQLKYGVTEDLWLGTAAKYESEKFAGQPDTAPALDTTGQYTQPIPSYTVYDVFADYRFTENLDLRLNVGNLTNEEYYTAGYQSGSFLYLGDARNYRLTLNAEF